MRHTIPNEIGKTGLSVIVRNNDVDGALKVLKKKIMQEGLIRDIKRIQYYETGTQKRRRKEQEAKKRWLKKKAILDMYF